MSANVFLNGNKRSAFLVILPWLVLLQFVSGCREKEEPEALPEVPRNVRVLELKPGRLTEYFEISGPVSPVRGADLSAEESGPVMAIKADKGQMVTRGSVVVELDRGILAAQLKSAEANLAAQSYNVDKVRKLNEAGKISEMELLNTESQFEQAEALVIINRDRFERAAIRAPFDGVIVERYVELGQLVMPGQRVARIIDPSHLKLEAYLTDQEVPWVKVGTEAFVKLGDNQGFAAGKIAWVGLEADLMTGKFKMELEIPNPEGKLRSGVIGRARIPKNILEGVVSIPRDAVLYSRLGTSVFVVNGDRAFKRPVALGADQGALVTVAKGLAVGEKVVVRGHRSLRDSSLVKVTEVATKSNGLMPDDPTELLEKSGSVEGDR